MRSRCCSRGEAEDACPVLIVATGATDKSRTAKLLADRPDALVAMFYPPDLRAVTDDGAQHGRCRRGHARRRPRRADRARRRARHPARAVRDRPSSRSTSTPPRRPRARPTQQALDAIGARTEDDGFAAAGQHRAVGRDRRVSRASCGGCASSALNPVGVLLAFERRAAQLAQLAARLGPRGDVTALIDAEAAARRVFWKDKRDLGNQLRKWRGKRLERLVARLAELHRALLGNSQSAELLLSQGLAEIARAAAAKG